MKSNFIFSLILICITVCSCFFIYSYNFVDKDFSKIDFSKVDNLMIVAHPDDEILWGGGNLIEDDYLVVCITCGLNKTRSREFKEVMEATNDQYIMLGYPDKVLGVRSNWKDEYDDIYNDLYNIISMKDWKMVVTHNVNGEYGHVHHKMTHKIVVNIFSDFNFDFDLYTFGKYYTKSKLNNLKVKPKEIDPKTLEIKKKLIEKYKSQDFVKKSFGHMNPYENFVKYTFEL